MRQGSTRVIGLAAAFLLLACQDEPEVEVSTGMVGDTPVVTAEIDPPGGPPVNITVAEKDGVMFLTDGAGNAIYVADSPGTPGGGGGGFRPVTGKATAAPPADASLIGVTTLPDGSLQVTYAEQPLYTYEEDRAAGDTKGQGKTVGGKTYSLVDPAGNKRGSKK